MTSWRNTCRVFELNLSYEDIDDYDGKANESEIEDTVEVQYDHSTKKKVKKKRKKLL